MRRLLRDPLPLLAAIVAVLLAGLAFLQHRSLASVSQAERARMKANAAGRAEAFARDLDREVTRAFLMLGADAEALDARDEAAYASTFARWRQQAQYPDLVAEVWVVSVDPARASIGAVRRFDPADGSFVAASLPAELTPLGARLAPEPGRRGAAGPGMGPTDGSIPALFIPAPRHAPLPPPPLRAAPDRLFLFHADMRPAAWTVVRLDRGVIEQHLLPALARRHASGPDGLEYHVTIAGPGRGGSSIVWRSDAAAPATPAGADASSSTFAVRLDDIDNAIFSRLLPEAGVSGLVGEASPPGPRRVMAFRFAATQREAAAGPGAWTVALSHRAGSVEAAVAAHQRRSAAVAGGILLLLAASAGLIVASARRERRLAHRQLEFVAAVSHELRTPLTVIRSAAENLRDGVVAEPARVREYGAVLREEGRRLSDMVEQVLAFAGADAGDGRRRGAVEVEPLLRAAVADAELGKAGLEVHVEVEPGLRVTGDAATLAAAVRNLLVNLRKYAREGGYAGLGARRVGTVAEIVVEDRGPGLEKDEVGRVFEPFFRGRRASESQAPGSGIGLALVRRIVEAHGGTVEARTLPRGAAFVLRLPAAAVAEQADPAGAAAPTEA
jgi:signal transduction histidine kinase